MTNIKRIDLSKLDDSPTNPRATFDEGALAELAASMKESGLIQPIVVRTNPTDPTRREIVVGHRRARAARLLEWAEIDAVVRDDLGGVQIEVWQLLENEMREGVGPLEEARAMHRALERPEMTQGELAAMMGKSNSYVCRRVKLMALIPEIAALLEQRRINLTSAEVLCDVPVELQQELVDAGLSPESLDRNGKPAMFATHNIRHMLGGRTRRLMHAPWTLESVCGELRACQGCPMRSSHQISLALSSSPDVEERCLNASCWNLKLQAYTDALLESHLAAGAQAYTEAHDKEHREGSWDVFVRANDKCWSAHEDERFLWGELAPEVQRYVEVPHGGYQTSYEVVERVRKAEVLEFMKESGDPRYWKVSHKKSPEELAAKEAKLSQGASDHAKLVGWARSQRPSRAVLVALLGALVVGLPAHACAQPARDAGWDGKKDAQAQGYLLEWVRSPRFTVGDALALIASLAVGRNHLLGYVPEAGFHALLEHIHGS